MTLFRAINLGSIPEKISSAGPARTVEDCFFIGRKYVNENKREVLTCR
jgi:hypothetical protein